MALTRTTTHLDDEERTLTTPAQPAAPAAAPAQTVGDLAGGGIIVGADPRPTPPTFTPVAPGNNPATVTGPVFTADDIAKARREEKDKLYPELQTMKDQLAQLQKERDEKLAQEREAREAAEAALESKRQEELTLAERLEEQKREFETRFQSLQQEREQERQVLEMERRFQSLQAFKARRLQEEAEFIVPELVDLAAGNSEEEIEASIAGLKERSSRIIEQMQAAAQQARAGMRGAPITAPPAGPIENYSGQDQAWEAAQNGSLTFDDYVKNRDKLLSGVSRSAGIYG